MTKVLYKLSSRNKVPVLNEIMTEFSLQSDEIDQEFGVQLIDPVASDYCILVEEEALKKIDSQYDIEGPFSNPTIDTFGPPEN